MKEISRNILVFTAAAIVTIMGGCADRLVRTDVDVSSIPDQTYDVVVYGSPSSWYYAVVLDIPDDGTEVFIRKNRYTKRIGMDSSRRYVEAFDNRIRFYRTVKISDENGVARGYLMVSIRLKHWIKRVEDGIMVIVEIDESYLGPR